MPLVFVSHSSKDRQAVERDVIAPLRRHGVTTWYSKDDIKSAAEWEKQIRDALKACDWFLIVLTPRAIESEWVQSEVDWALEQRKGKVIPIMLESCDPTDLHLRLRRIQFVDFRDDLEKAQQKLLAIWGLDTATQVASRLNSANEAISKAEWATAINHLEIVLRLEPENIKAQTDLENVRRQDELSALYTMGISHLNNSQWHDALKALRRVRTIDRNYMDVAERIAEADAHLAEEEGFTRNNKNSDLASTTGLDKQSQIHAINSVGGEGLVASAPGGDPEIPAELPSSESEQPSTGENNQEPQIQSLEDSQVYDSSARRYAVVAIAIATLAVTVAAIYFYTVPKFRQQINGNNIDTNQNTNSHNTAENPQNSNATTATLASSKLGDSLFEQKEFSEAEIEYKRLAAERPYDGTLQLKLGKTQFELNKDTEAVNTLGNAVRVLQNDSEAHAYYGRALVKKKQYTLAEQELREAVRLKPDSAEYYYYLGVALSWQKKWAETKEAYSKALQLDPGNEKVKKLLKEIK